MAYPDPYPGKHQARTVELAQTNRRESLALNYTALALVVAGFLLHNWPL